MGVAKQSVKQARRIKPRHIAKLADREFQLLLVGADAEDRDRLTEFFIPFTLPVAEREPALARMEATIAEDPDLADLRKRADAAVCTPAAAGRLTAAPPPRVTANEFVTLDLEQPAPGAAELLRRHGDLLLALGRRFPNLRPVAMHSLIQSVAMRNATVAALSAIPEVVPTPVGLAWTLGEFASDTIVLTGNQIRLALQMAALHGRPTGWIDQGRGILAILAGAFGWRALARTLVSLVPGGAGLTVKTGIAYGGTIAVGRYLARRYPKYGAQPLHPPAHEVLEHLPSGRWQPRSLPNLAAR